MSNETNKPYAILYTNVGRGLTIHSQYASMEEAREVHKWKTPSSRYCVVDLRTNKMPINGVTYSPS